MLERCGETRWLLCYTCKYKRVKATPENSWQFLITDRQLSDYPEIDSSAFILEKGKLTLMKKSYMKVHSSLPEELKNWNHLTCPEIDEWLDKVLYSIPKNSAQ